MYRFYLKLAIPFFTLFVVFLLIIHAQPYNDHDLALLIPSDCQMPCFMGIRPGLTTGIEARNILEASGWVKNLTKVRQYVSRNVNEYTWEWNTFFPFSAASSVPYGNFLTLHGDVVVSVVVGTSITPADFDIAWGEPAQYSVVTIDPGRLYYAYIYPQNGIRVIGQTICPYIPRFWSQSTNLVVGDATGFQTQQDRLNDGLFLKQSVLFNQQNCQS